MSRADRPRREWRFYVDDMIGFAERFPAYTAGMDRQSFAGDGRTYDAVPRNLELIGEAASILLTPHPS